MKVRNYLWRRVGIISLFCGLLVAIYFVFHRYNVIQTNGQFNTLQKMEAYAKKLEEYPEPDSERYLKPDYTSFFKETTQTKTQRFWEKIFVYFRIWSVRPWSAELFLELLKKIEEERRKLRPGGDFIVRLIPKVDSKIVVWGDIQGAFHSLTRYLKKLEEIGIINDNLKIVNPNDYFIFNGDLISRSPYNLETLTVALKLMEKNPEQVFYIKGNHEMYNYWYGFGMKRELKFKAAHLSNQTVPLEKEINEFFATLPLTVYIGMPPNVTKNFVRISHLETSAFPKLHHENYSGFLVENNKDQTHKIVDIDAIKKSKHPISIKVRIMGLSREFTYEENDGLKLLSPKRGATAWTLMSCPTLVYQKEFDFFYDAFGIITVGTSPGKWTIELYNQDVRKMDGFKSKEYNLITGK